MITDKAIRRGSFTSVQKLFQRIDHFVARPHLKPASRFTLTAHRQIRSSKSCIDLAHVSVGQGHQR